MRISGKGPMQPVFGKINLSEDTCVEVPNGISRPFGTLPASPKYGARNRQPSGPLGNDTGGNRSGE
jgi:hypothetical protein